MYKEIPTIVLLRNQHHLLCPHAESLHRRIAAAENDFMTN
jgi:hypothetical protein